MSYLDPKNSTQGGTTQIREVMVSYRGRKRTMPCALSGPDHVAAFMRRLVGNDAREHFVVIHLDARHKPIGYQVTSVGTATASLIHPREVFQAAITVGAVAIIASHNHPSGDPKPSAEDQAITKRLGDAGRLLGISLLDHVVCGSRGRFHSTREQDPDQLNGS